MDRIRNEVIRSKVGVAPIEDKVREDRLRWYVHVQRRPLEALVRAWEDILIPNTRRGRGRPRITDEGIILKDLGSKWEPSDRSGKWLKLKPDYVRAGSDLDVLIIGGYYGSGRRGGEVAQFLVGIAERPTPNTHPRRVGTGLSDEDLDAVVNKLKPFFRKYEYPKKAPPSFYQVTNNSKERPDVWIDSPEKSIILSITSDIRTIRSEVFAAPYSLRFPRIDRVRYDKPWHECLDVQSFIELVQTTNGTTHRGTDSAAVQHSKQKRTKSSTREDKKKLSVVPSHLVQTDISGVKEGDTIFSGMMFWIKFQAAKLRGDIIHYSWLLNCSSQKKLLPLQPKYFLFLSDSSKKKLQEEIDEFSDSYYWDLDLAGIKQLLSNVDRAEDTKTIDHFKEKYSLAKWSRFHGCFIYFHASPESLKPDWEVLLGLSLRRLKVEVNMNGGRVSNSLAQATHLVVLSVPGFTLDLENVLQSFSGTEKRLIWNGKLHIVQSQWLEDCVEREQRLPEETYSLKPLLEQLKIEDWNQDMDLEVSSDLDIVKKQNVSLSPSKEGNNRKGSEAPESPGIRPVLEVGSKRKRGRPAGNRGKAVAKPARKTRARVGSKAAKISGNESDDSVSDEENTTKEESKQLGESHGNIVEEQSQISKAKGGAKQVRRTRARIGKKPAKISGNESEDNASQDESTFKEPANKQIEDIHERIDIGTSQTRETKTIEKSESSEKGNADKQEGEGNIRYWFNKVPENETSEKQNSENSQPPPPPPEKLELMTDPVHAMLLDMIPRLGKEKVEITNTSTEDKKPAVDPNAPQPKKKKVSYKDIAGDLLKDW
ncbi:DNA ligase 4 [Morus notabilis]|uniref:DNA ligase IV n=1 Tax=Morus notabilis TaxID=981085 RepID=W9SIR1_9ROSA|nr:DNA ligase 4 [Morus notabilis]